MIRPPLSGYTTGISQGNAMTSMENPVAKVNLLKDKREVFRFLGDVALNYNILPGLNLKLSGSANINSYHADNITPSTVGAYNELPPKQNAIQSTARRTINLQSAIQLSYNRKFTGGPQLGRCGCLRTQFEKMHEVLARCRGHLDRRPAYCRQLFGRRLPSGTVGTRRMGADVRCSPSQL